MIGTKIRLKLNKEVWLVLIPLLFGMGSILRTSGLLKYWGDYRTALIFSLQDDPQGKFKGFYTVGRIFHAINIFGIETLNGWSLFLTVVFIPIIYCYCKKLTKLSVSKMIFICGFIIFFSACVCNISKETVQFFMFAWVDAVAFSKIIKSKILKFILIFLVFLLNGLLLRTYFYLVAIVFAALSIMYILNFKRKRMSLVRDLCIFFLLGFVALTAGKICAPELCYKVANTRASLIRTYSNANTLIRNDININNFQMNWLINYAITSFRIMFPVEFLLKGMKYIPFVVVQIIFSMNLIKVYRESNYRSDNYKFAYFSLLAFIVVELVWEVDLGTMFRHETSVIVLLIDVILQDDNIKRKTLYQIRKQHS